MLRHLSPKVMPPNQTGPLHLRAGPLSMRFDPETGFVRHIRAGGREVLRGVYVAVRDRNWKTIRPSVTVVELDRTPGGFRLVLDVETREGEIHFQWRGVVQGEANGTLRYTMDGSARSSFLRNRIGFCVLHPSDACAGQRCWLEHSEGEWEESRFPVEISPHQPFRDLIGIAHEPEPGLRVEVKLSGDVFETEDQRNWTDASFKTYCTPLEIPVPVLLREGEQVRQEVTLAISGAPPVAHGNEAVNGNVHVHVLRDVVGTLPAIGLQHDGGRALEPSAVERLRALRPAHLRVDLHLSDAAMPERLRRGWEAAAAIGAPLELALFLSGDAERELERLPPLLEEVGARIARWLVFHEDEKSTSARWALRVRDALGDARGGAPVGVGSNGNFVELNRGRPDWGEMDFVCYPVNPQVHAFDDLSLMETLAIQGETVENARRFSGVPVVVSPVTLGAKTKAPANPGRAPNRRYPRSQVDVRQARLFGAAWTVGSIKHLAECGAASVTYYEAADGTGIMEAQEDSSARGDDGGQPKVFPLYHVLADALEQTGGQVLRTTSSDPLRVTALAIRTEDRVRVLVANLSPEVQTAMLADLPLGGTRRIRLLDAGSLDKATRDPERFREQAWTALTSADPEQHLELKAHACACIDFAADAPWRR